ncbi:MAG: hypothetical protein ISQ32_02490 [Rickettsiales bacterium]|nr:hypothetical protein [Rickettsiales bacterium]
MRSALSIMELVVVIIMLGILTTVVMYNKEFKSAAQVRAAMKQFIDYQADINNFRSRFESLPGDFERAYDFWPDKCASETQCNGDGNGLIDSYKESHLAWLHLADAGYISGNYTGQGYQDNNTSREGVNAPSGAISETQLSLTNPTYDFLANRNFLIMGSFKSGDLGYGGGISPIQAARIDEKIDNGLPTGRLSGRNGFVNGSFDSGECLISDANIILANTDDLSQSFYNENLGNLKHCILAYRLD